MTTKRFLIPLIMLFSITCYSQENLDNSFENLGSSHEAYGVLYDSFGALPSDIIKATESGSFYTLWGDGRGISQYELEPDPKLIFNEKLTKFEDHLFLASEYLAASEYIASMHGEEFSRPDDPMALVLDRTPTYAPLSFSTADSHYGCLEKHPLRYGDLTEDGEDELIITTNYNIIIFSLSENKVVFSSHYFQNDELSEEEKENWNIKNDKPSDPVYVASSVTDVMDKAPLLPAWRSLSKLYFGSFAEENTQDIILWRKVYQSPLNSDGEEGFLPLGQRFEHYQYKSGQYEIQPTESEQLEQWLIDVDLTWQKGYPSQSECEGKEGELIPEMHDPLLNDPDVLQ